MTTFLFTSDVLNAPLGAYAWTHNSSGTPASAIGTHASLLKNSVIVMFAGLVLLDVANMALVLTIVDAAGDTHDQPAAAGDKQVAATQEEAAPATADDAAAAV